MIRVNDHFVEMPLNYLFADIAKRVKAYRETLVVDDIISLGIGDVTRPLAPAVVEAMREAVEEMGERTTFRGYGPEQGYGFLKRAILENDFQPRGINLDESEIFINDGAKSDTGNIGDILDLTNSVAVTDPVYPVYIDSNAMCGRAGVMGNGHWSNITYLPTTEENGFVPQIPNHPVDMIYLCYPNNPTGTTLSRAELERWVEYATAHHSLILYDAAYEAYIRQPDVPHSIYEIPGAEKVAIEFHSYSKTAGFTGVRCGYTVIPKGVTALDKHDDPVALNPLWLRRQCTKFNGTSYISQRAAAAIYTPQGREQIQATIDYYMENAALMLTTLRNLGYTVYGGENAPYLWVKTPQGVGSWDFFEMLLHEAHLICTPGVGFGPSGEGYVRLTSFGNREDCLEALRRIAQVNCCADKIGTL